MKLAEALVLRSDCNNRIAQIKQRLERCVKVQEGEEAPEKPETLFKEMDRLIGELTVLIIKINKTNNVIGFNESTTLAEALAERDTIAIKRGVMEHLIDHASVKYDRFSRSEVKYISKVDIAELQKQKDELSKKYRELDLAIQQINWNTDLLES